MAKSVCPLDCGIPLPGRSGCDGEFTQPIANCLIIFIYEVCIVRDTPIHRRSDGRLGLEAFFGPKSGSKRLMKCYVSTPSRVKKWVMDSSTNTEQPFVRAVAAGRYWSFAIAD